MGHMTSGVVDGSLISQTASAGPDSTSVNCFNKSGVNCMECKLLVNEECNNCYPTGQSISRSRGFAWINDSPNWEGSTNILKRAVQRVSCPETFPSTSPLTEFVSVVPSMTIMSVMFSALLAFVLFFNVVSALPLTLVARDSVDPPITNPVAGAVWHVGDLVTVTWDTSVFVGVNVTNATGTIVLGFLENDSENLMLNSPLAEGFSLFTGSQDVTVPDVPSKTDYVIALLGSSGNISPEFQIVPKLVATPSPPISELPLSSSPSAVPTSSLPTPTSSGASVSTPASTPLSTPVPTPSVTPTTTPSPTSTPTTPVSSATSTPTTPVLSPTSTSLVTASPSAGVPASDNSNTNDAFTSKHVKMSSVLLAAAVALFMI